MPDEKAQLKILWFALLMSIVLYGVIAFLIVPMGTQTFNALFANPTILILHLAGLAVFATSFLIPSILKTTNVRTTSIIRWAMIESAAVFGLLAAFLGQDVRLFLPLGALAIAGMVLAYPRG